jgi:hypothetical protein
MEKQYQPMKSNEIRCNSMEPFDFIGVHGASVSLREQWRLVRFEILTIEDTKSLRTLVPQNLSTSGP